MSAQNSGDWSSDVEVAPKKKRFPWLILIPVGCFFLLIGGGLLATLIIPSLLEDFQDIDEIAPSIVQAPRKLIRGEDVAQRARSTIEREAGLVPPLGADGEELLWGYFLENSMKAGGSFLTTARVGSYPDQGGSPEGGPLWRNLQDVRSVWFEPAEAELVDTAVWVYVTQDDYIVMFLSPMDGLDREFLADLERLCSELSGEEFEGVFETSDEGEETSEEGK